MYFKLHCYSLLWQLPIVEGQNAVKFLIYTCDYAKTETSIDIRNVKWKNIHIAQRIIATFTLVLANALICDKDSNLHFMFPLNSTQSKSLTQKQIQISEMLTSLTHWLWQLSKPYSANFELPAKCVSSSWNSLSLLLSLIGKYIAFFTMLL